VSGDRVVFFGDAMTTVVHGVREVTHLLGEPPVVVGGWRSSRAWLVRIEPRWTWTSSTEGLAMRRTSRC
jgi:flagellar biosynthesis/type III secretory pathway ATPase